MTPPIVLITGATDGLGLALARRHRQAGDALILLGRRPAPVGDPLFSDAGVRYIQLDLAQADAATRLAQALALHGIDRIDRVVHNAAMGSYGPFADDAPEQITRMVATNLTAPITLTHALAPALARAKGKVIFVSSVVAELPCAEYAVYGATKAALSGFARSLHVEWRGRIDVQAIHPGAVRTSFHEKSGVPAHLVASPRIPTASRAADDLYRLADSSKRAPSLGASNALMRLVGRRLGRVLDGALRRKQGRGAPRPGAIERVLVTGAAQGIGRAVADAYVARGVEVVGLDVDPHGLPFRCDPCDLSDAAAIEAWLLRAASEAPFDVVVHNAGVNESGPFETLDRDVTARMLAINLSAPLLLTAGLHRAGRLAEGGSLVFVASLSHQVGYPGAAAYAASKDGLTSYARSMHVALGPQGTHVLTVFPGPTRTAQAAKASPEGSDESKRMPPEVLAAQMLRAVDRRGRTLVPGAGNKVFAWLGRTLPSLTERGMRKAIYEPLLARDPSGLR